MRNYQNTRAIRWTAGIFLKKSLKKMLIIEPDSHKMVSYYDSNLWDDRKQTKNYIIK